MPTQITRKKNHHLYENLNPTLTFYSYNWYRSKTLLTIIPNKGESNMKKTLLTVISAIIFILLLTACSAADTKDNNDKPDNQTTNNDETANDNEAEPTNTSLPDGFPADFPFPPDITITEVRDESEGDQKSYTIRFTFNPDMDLEPVFDMYTDYTEKIGYEPMLEGEEFFKDGIFQYAALKEMSTSNMYVVTLKPADGTYGSIDLKYKKE